MDKPVSRSGSIGNPYVSISAGNQNRGAVRTPPGAAVPSGCIGSIECGIVVQFYRDAATRQSPPG